MSAKTLIWIGMAVGGMVGGYVPILWGASMFSMSSIFGNAIGAMIGIWAGFKTSRYF